MFPPLLLKKSQMRYTLTSRNCFDLPAGLNPLQVKQFYNIIGLFPVFFRQPSIGNIFQLILQSG